MALIIPWILVILWNEVHMLPSTAADDNVSVKDLHSCEEGWKRYDQYCFKHVKNLLSRSGASSECKNMGGHLATIHSKEHNDFMEDLTAKSLGIPCWIGLYIRDLDDLMYLYHHATHEEYTHKLNDLCSWDDETDVDYTNWGPYQPSFDGQCVEIFISNYSTHPPGSWNSMDCSKLGTFLCQKMVAISANTRAGTASGTIYMPPTSIVYSESKELYSCEEDWKRYDQYCYKRENYHQLSDLNWRDGSLKCNSLGGQLASIHSKEQNDFLEDLCDVSRYHYGCWIGLYEHVVQGTFTWSDETEVDYTNWKPTTPGGEYSDGKCVGLKNHTSRVNNGSWDVWSCARIHPILCQKKLTTSATVGTDINRETETSLHTNMQITYGAGFISVTSYVIAIIMFIVLISLIGGMVYYKRHWLQEKRYRSTVLFKRSIEEPSQIHQSQVTDSATEFILEPNSTI